MAKVKQKVSGCFRVELYAKAYCRISSYLQTMANKGVNPLIAIQMALAGNSENIGGEQLPNNNDWAINTYCELCLCLMKAVTYIIFERTS